MRTHAPDTASLSVGQSPAGSPSSARAMPARGRIAVSLLLGLAVAGCAAGTGGRAAPARTGFETRTLRVVIAPSTPGWRLEEPGQSPPGAPLLESRIAVEIDPGGRIEGTLRADPDGDGEPHETALGPARVWTTTLSAPSARLEIELAVTVLERRRAAILAAVLHNDSTQAVTVRRILLADPSATRVSTPVPPDRLRLLIVPASTREAAHVWPGGAAPVPPSFGYTAAVDPATRWTLLAGFPCARAGMGTLTWVHAPSGEPPALGLGAVVETGPVRLGPDERFAADELLIVCEPGPQAALEAFAALARETASGRRPAQAAAPEGIAAWGTGLAFRGDLAEDDLLRNLDFAARHLKAAGLGTILVEDGFQRAAGDWETHARLPRGHRWITQQIHARGFRAGLALAPLDVAEQSPLFAARPAWLFREGAGPRDRRLDASNPDARKWLAELAGRIASEWGYDAVLVERLAPDTPLHAPAGESAARPGAADLRRVLETFREALGPDRRLIAADAPPSALAGLADAVRVGPSAGSSWEGVREAALALAVAQAFNRPPGCSGSAGISLAPPLTDDEARTWASLLAMTGGLLIAGDNLPLLPPSRAALLQRLLPPLPGGARAVDLFDRDHRRGPALRSADASDATPPLPLPALWRLSTGDQPAWADPAWNDADWPRVPVPSRWEESGLAGYSGCAWYRVRFDIPPGRPRWDQILDLGRIGGADATFVNGTLVGSTGRFPPDALPRPDEMRRYAVPAALLKWPSGAAPSANTLAVRVHARGGMGGIGPEGPALPPAVWHRPVAPGDEAGDLVLLANWTDAPARIDVPLARLGLPGGGRWVAHDATEDELIDVRDDRLEAEVRPHASRLVLLRRDAGRPQVVATSRHLVPCEVDLERATWDAGTRTLTGRSRRLVASAHRVPGTAEPGYAVTLHVPPGFRLARAEASIPCLAARAGRCLLRVEFPSVTADAIDWSIRFAEAPAR
jgi:hypothetical protein